MAEKAVFSRREHEHESDGGSARKCALSGSVVCQEVCSVRKCFNLAQCAATRCTHCNLQGPAAAHTFDRSLPGTVWPDARIAS